MLLHFSLLLCPDYWILPLYRPIYPLCAEARKLGQDKTFKYYTYTFIIKNGNVARSMWGTMMDVNAVWIQAAFSLPQWKCWPCFFVQDRQSRSDSGMNDKHDKDNSDGQLIDMTISDACSSWEEWFQLLCGILVQVSNRNEKHKKQFIELHVFIAMDNI